MRAINDHLAALNSSIAEFRKAHHVLHAQLLIQELTRRDLEFAQTEQRGQAKTMALCTIIIAVLTVIIAILTAVMTWGTVFVKSASGADISNGDLSKACHQQSTVYSQKGEPVAENIDPFCAGYLQRSLQTLLSNPNINCTPSLVHDQTVESLLSIYLTYQKDKNIAGSVAAAPTLLSAYARAFDCGSN